MAEEVTLSYFDGRGFGECIRLLLCAAGIKFQEKLVRTREHYLKLCQDGELLFDQLPLLEIDGLRLVQHRAIMLYVARKAGMLGANDREFVKILMYFEGMKDAYADFMPFAILGDESKYLPELRDKTLPKYLPVFNKALSDNGTGFLVGDRMSLADCSLLELLLAVEDYFGLEFLAGYPKLKEFLAQRKETDRISRYLREVRKRKNDAAYGQDIKTILSHKYGNI